ncbi:MAG: hypothetical protein LQ337_003444 [Flavoplaca oasis]|nr:MAG: hypothetical protein LQ337_003444 [Flavoplaca oasis]
MQYFQKLADIPASPFETHAGIRSSEVLSFQGETRRKRPEIALAVDGYGIEIQETGKVAGQTFRPASTTFDLPEPNVPIVHIEAFANPGSNSETPALDILCVHQDGQLSCYDEALTRRKWGPQIGFAPDVIQLGQSDVIQVSSVNISKARKTFLKNRDDVLDDAQLLAYHDPSGTAILLNGRKLLAVDLSGTFTSRSSTSRKRKRGGLLIDAIGRGSLSVYTRPPPPKHTVSSSLALGDLMDPHQESTEWEEQKIALNALLEKGDHHEFDRQVSSSLDELFKNGLSNMHNDRLTSSTHAPPRIVEYVLGQMFSSSPHNGPDHGANQVQRELYMKLFFGKIWHNLIRHGLISTERVEAVIRREDNLGLNTNLRVGGLIRAVAECDESLAALLDLLRSSCLIHGSELCHALKVVISRYSAFVAGHGQKLLSNGNEPGIFTDNSRNDMDMLNGSPNNTLQQLSGDSDLLPSILDVIIARYDACPTATVTKAFKDHLSSSELQTLVVLLRTKLRQNGWLSSYTEDGLTVDRESQHKDREISMIGKLMSCAVDSLGTGGWLLNNDLTNNNAEAVETISNIQAEISTALEGIWEANYLRALLGELLICGKGALKFQTARVQPALDWRGTPKTALPLGLKLEQDISLVKVGAGGELQTRSRRDIGKLKSRRVPKYSFEQIAI